MGRVGKAKWTPWPTEATATLSQRPTRPQPPPRKGSAKARSSTPRSNAPPQTNFRYFDPVPLRQTSGSVFESLSPLDWEQPEKAVATP